MKKIIAVLGCLLIGFLMNAQTYTIPGATEQPAWVFPLWFEDGTGAKDTLYLAQDYYALNTGIDESDIVFGESLVVLDTANFFTCWQWPYMDSLGNKVIVLKDLWFFLYITFNKAQFPVKIKWDDNLFYNSIIPYPDNGDLPRAWALFGCHDYSPEYPNCYPLGDLPLLFTDTIVGPPYLFEIWRKDSMVFNGPEDAYLLDLPTFGIMPYNQFEYVPIKNIDVDIISIFPNPFSDLLFLKSNYLMEEITIYNLINQVVFRSENINIFFINLDLMYLPSNSIYILHVSTEYGDGFYKLIKN